MQNQKVFVSDTTLRNGEQSAGVSFTLNQKLKIVHQLPKLGVDIIEAGFPRTSPGDLEAVQQISKEVRGCHPSRGERHAQNGERHARCA